MRRAFRLARCASFHALRLRETRPAKITGASRACNSAAARTIGLRRTRREAGGAKRASIGERKRRVERLLLERGVENVDRAARRRRAQSARRAASIRRAAVTEAGWSSHFVSCAPARPGRAWCGSSRSTAGASPRRSARSRPSTSTGTRSHQALKIAIVACISPTLLCTIARHRLVRSPWRSRARSRPRAPRAGTAASSDRVAEVVDEAVVQTAIARAGVQRDVRDVERAQRLGHRVAAEQRLPDGSGNGCSIGTPERSARQFCWFAMSAILFRAPLQTYNRSAAACREGFAWENPAARAPRQETSKIKCLRRNIQKQTLTSQAGGHATSLQSVAVAWRIRG